MKTRLTLACMAVLAVLPAPAFAESYRFTKAVVCREWNPNSMTLEIARSEFLDFFDARARGTPLDLGQGSSMDDALAYALKNVARLSPLRAREIGDFAQDFSSKAKFATSLETSDPETTDAYGRTPIFLPDGCTKETTILRDLDENSGEITYYVHEKMWRQMTTIDQAGVLLHEAIIGEDSEPNQASIRALEMLLVSPDLQTMTFHQFADRAYALPSSPWVDYMGVKIDAVTDYYDDWHPKTISADEFESAPSFKWNGVEFQVLTSQPLVFHPSGAYQSFGTAESDTASFKVPNAIVVIDDGTGMVDLVIEANPSGKVMSFTGVSQYTAAGKASFSSNTDIDFSAATFDENTGDLTSIKLYNSGDLIDKGGKKINCSADWIVKIDAKGQFISCAP